PATLFGEAGGGEPAAAGAGLLYCAWRGVAADAPAAVTAATTSSVSRMSRTERCMDIERGYAAPSAPASDKRPVPSPRQAARKGAQTPDAPRSGRPACLASRSAA